MDTNHDSEGYGNAHRALLQAFMAQSTFTLAQAKPALAAILSAQGERQVLAEDVTEADLDSHVGAINAAVSPLDLEIRSAWTQPTLEQRRTRKYALVNTSGDSISKLATVHSADEIAYIRRLLDHMFDRNNTASREVMGATRVEALRLNRAQQGSGSRASNVGLADEAGGGGGGSITAKEAERLLKTLVDEDWLQRRGDFYTLSARGLMELRAYLLTTYNNDGDGDGDGDEADAGRGPRIKLCQACKDIVTSGQRCRQRECTARLHDHCVASFFRAQRADVCPLCREAWTGQDFVGERALARERGSAGGSSRRHSSMHEGGDSDDDGGGDGDGADDGSDD